ncbi:MAG: hypothetical protein ACI9R3_005492 [Verrucomicrobiales bacterium]|jgi:hypothetical protein
MLDAGFGVGIIDPKGAVESRRFTEGFQRATSASMILRGARLARVRRFGKAEKFTRNSLQAGHH